MSPANRAPGTAIGSHSTLVVAGAAPSQRIHSHSKGRARNKRWKPVATGPSSDKRTKIGEKPIAMPPTSSAGSARRGGSSADEDIGPRRRLRHHDHEMEAVIT